MRSVNSWLVLASFAACCILVSSKSGYSKEKIIPLLDAADSLHHQDFDLRDHVSAAISSRWQLEVRTLHGGMQEGVQLLQVDNGRLRISIVLNRGLSILGVEESLTGERVFGWDSPVKEIVNPMFIDLESRGGLGWLYGFNEWLVRCGLEFAGHPGTDLLRSNTGETKELDLTLHGRIGNIPASKVQVLIDEDKPSYLRIRGVIEERMFYGPQLRLTSDLILVAGKPSIQLEESIQNLSASPQEYQIIYHTNFGTPILQRGSKVVPAAKSVTPMNDHAARSVDRFDLYDAPTIGFTEEVYLVEPWVDEDGMTGAVLHNEAGNCGAMMTWSAETLPYLTIWKNTAGIEDGYVTGIEPGSGYPFNRRIERHFGRVPILQAKETRIFRLNYTYLDSSSSVKTAISRINKIQMDRPRELHHSPPELPKFE